MHAPILHLHIPSAPATAPHRVATTTRLRAARPQMLTGVRGQTWVTIDNDPRDLVLGSGQRITVPADRNVVITSLQPHAAFEVLVAAVPGPAVTPRPAPPPRSARPAWRLAWQQLVTAVVPRRFTGLPS